MKFKKTLLTMVALGTLAGNAFGLEVGDKMPNYFGRDVTKIIDLTKAGTSVNFHPHPSFFEKQKSASEFKFASAINTSRECEITGKPFAMYSFEENKIYVDLVGNGEIGKVLENTGKERILTLSPYRCNLPKKST